MKFKVGEQVLISNVKQVKSRDMGYILEYCNIKEPFKIERVEYPTSIMRPWATIQQGEFGLLVDTRFLKRIKK